MADGGANHPAARALRPPATSREGAVSSSRFATPKPYVVPPPPSQNGPVSLPATAPPLPETPPALAAGASNDAPPATVTENSVPSLAQLRRESSAAEASQPAVASAWGEFATAPTLLLTPRDDAEADEAASTSRMFTPSTSDDAASTSRIATPSTPPLEQQPWYRTGTTVPPPSMRPPAESAPAVRPAPSPRVLKIVAGVIGGCLFIVAIAGAKVLYKWSTTPAVAPIATTATLAHPAAPPSAVTAPPAAPPESTAVAATPTATREAPAAPAAATPSPEFRRSTPPRTTTTRTPAKTAPRRAPTTKKVVKSTH